MTRPLAVGNVAPPSMGPTIGACNRSGA